MKGGYVSCQQTSRGVWQKFVDINIEGLNNVDAINQHNIINWKKITGISNIIPKMLQLTWNEIEGNYSDNTRIRKKRKSNPDFIPEEFIIFYHCDYLRPKKTNNYSRADLLCKKHGLYGWSEGNKQNNLNYLSCKDPCRPYKRCYNYNCCNLDIPINKEANIVESKLLYCQSCKRLKSTIIAFNLFEIMRQILVAKCSLGEKNILPYLLNPVTQEPFTEEELNTFPILFKQAIDSWKQNYNIDKSFLRKNVRRLTSTYKYVGPALMITTSLLIPGGQVAAILGLMSSVIWSVGYLETIENVW
jgi:hypothetical protein